MLREKAHPNQIKNDIVNRIRSACKQKQFTKGDAVNRFSCNVYSIS